jgi:AcrR family transcriptional regulator
MYQRTRGLPNRRFIGEGDETADERPQIGPANPLRPLDHQWGQYGGAKRGILEHVTKPTVQLRSGRGAQTRQRLVAATIELVAENGWEHVTTRQIARRAESNQALINYHFGSKAGLLRAAVEAALRDGFGAPLQAMQQAPSFADGCVALIAEMAAMDEAEPIVRFSMEALARAPRDEELRQTIADLLAELRQVLALGIAEAQQRGEIPAAIDPGGTAALLGGVFDGLGLHQLIDPSLDLASASAALRHLLTGTKEDS